MKSLKSLKQTISILSLAVLALFAAQYFLYRDIKTKNEKVGTLEHELSLQNNRQDYLISMQRLIQSMSGDIESINNSIVPADGDVEFIENIESIGKNNGLKVTIDSLVFEDDPSYKNANVTGLKVKAKTSGSWSGTYAFLTELESLPVKVKINRFALSNVSSDAGIDTKKTGQIWQTGFEIVVLKYK